MTVALQNKLDNPTCLAQIGAKIEVADPIEWYDSATNTYIKAIVMGKTAKPARWETMANTPLLAQAR